MDHTAIVEARDLWRSELQARFEEGRKAVRDDFENRGMGDSSGVEWVVGRIDERRRRFSSLLDVAVREAEAGNAMSLILFGTCIPDRWY